jgi:prefoldin subunit 5
MYKEQVAKMRENIRLFKDSIQQLQQKNQELQTSTLLQSQAFG